VGVSDDGEKAGGADDGAAGAAGGGDVRGFDITDRFRVIVVVCYSINFAWAQDDASFRGLCNLSRRYSGSPTSSSTLHFVVNRINGNRAMHSDGGYAHQKSGRIRVSI
jgi:hypothetical protein